MPVLDNWSNTPYEIIQQIYVKQNGSSEYEKEVEQYFTSKLSSTSAWNSIVSLNEVPLKDVKHGQLVRFRGMIQDQLGLEMYSSGAVIKNSKNGTQNIVTGKYQDELAMGVNDEILSWGSTESRQCYFCVPIPGETPWVKQVHTEKFNQLNWGAPFECQGGRKRPLDDDEMDVSESEFKRPRAVNSGAGPSTLSSTDVTKILNYPIPSSETIACIVKMYTESELMLNVVMEVVGIVSFNTPGVSEEREDFQPPSSVIPRIHCLVSAPWEHNNPLLNRQLSPLWKEEVSSILSSASSIRYEMHGLLTELFKGDTLAADYLLCHLVSNIYCRKDALALGKLALNLTGFGVASNSTQNYVEIVSKLVETLVTKAHYLPLSLANMNTARIVPKKDYQINRLISGRLQLSRHTHLILDETALSEGQLMAEGVRNMTALGNMISWQKVEYDFNFHNVDFTSDVAVLILSERKSLLPSDVCLPLRSASDSTDFRDPSLLIQSLESNLDLLNRMRMYLSVVRLTEFSLGAHMQEVVQQDFIQSRAPGKENPMSPEDFHLLLVLSRLLALTHGQTELTETLWHKAIAMEVERKSRIQANQR